MENPENERHEIYKSKQQQFKIQTIACICYGGICAMGLVLYSIVNYYNELSIEWGLVAFILPFIAAYDSKQMYTKYYAIRCYFEELQKGKVDDAERDNIEKWISPLDENKYKIKHNIPIGLHEIREVNRNKIFKLGTIFMIGMAILILVIFSKFPYLIAWESLALYIIIMFEFLWFQFLISKSGYINVFTKDHKIRTSSVGTKSYKYLKCHKQFRKFPYSYKSNRGLELYKIKRKNTKNEELKYLKKILYARYDRLNNYSLTLTIVIKVIQYISALLAIIIMGNNKIIQDWFCINDSAKIVPVILEIISTGLFGAKTIMDLLVVKKEKTIKDCLNATSKHVVYENIPDLLEYRTIFDGNALDIARGTYEYNIEILNGNDNKINSKFIFTLRHRIINNIPRVKLSALTGFIFMFCIFVWNRTDISKLPYVIFFTMIIFIGSFVCMFLFDMLKFKEWGQFCKRIDQIDYKTKL